jgi:hypothetical protein
VKNCEYGSTVFFPEKTARDEIANEMTAKAAEKNKYTIFKVLTN